MSIVGRRGLETVCAVSQGASRRRCADAGPWLFRRRIGTLCERGPFGRYHCSSHTFTRFPANSLPRSIHEKFDQRVLQTPVQHIELFSQAVGLIAAVHGRQRIVDDFGPAFFLIVLLS